MNQVCTGLSLVAVVTLATPGTVTAQFTVNESTVFEALGSALIEKASGWLLRASRDTTSIALEITLPEGATTPQWVSLRDFLMRSLHGRPPRESDQERHVLTLAADFVGSDTLRAFIEVGFRTRCNGNWIEDGTGYTIRWSQGGGGKYWRYPKREEAIAIDSFGCPVKQ